MLAPRDRNNSCLSGATHPEFRLLFRKTSREPQQDGELHVAGYRVETTVLTLGPNSTS
jgi:hypothetical protein